MQVKNFAPKILSPINGFTGPLNSGRGSKKQENCETTKKSKHRLNEINPKIMSNFALQKEKILITTQIN